MKTRTPGTLSDLAHHAFVGQSGALYIANPTDPSRYAKYTGIEGYNSRTGFEGYVDAAVAKKDFVRDVQLDLATLRIVD